MGDKAPGSHMFQRRHFDLEILKKSFYFGRVRKRDERHPLHGDEYQEVQPHAHREIKMTDQRQDLPLSRSSGLTSSRASSRVNFRI